MLLQVFIFLFKGLNILIKLVHFVLVDSHGFHYLVVDFSGPLKFFLVLFKLLLLGLYDVIAFLEALLINWILTL